MSLARERRHIQRTSVIAVNDINGDISHHKKLSFSVFRYILPYICQKVNIYGVCLGSSFCGSVKNMGLLRVLNSYGVPENARHFRGLCVLKSF